jgi:hypothetical protein
MGKADDGGRIGYRQSPPAFSRRYDLCPGTALRFPMSVRNAASREITAPMPTFRCLSHSPPPQCCGRPSRVIACSQSRGELDYPPTLPPPQPPNWISLPSDRGILTRTLAKRTGSSRPLARTYATDTGRAQDRGCATGSPSGSYCFPLVFLQIGLRYSFDALDHWSKQLNQSFENAALLPARPCKTRVVLGPQVRFSCSCMVGSLANPD